MKKILAYSWFGFIALSFLIAAYYEPVMRLFVGMCAFVGITLWAVLQVLPPSWKK